MTRPVSILTGPQTHQGNADNPTATRPPTSSRFRTRTTRNRVRRSHAAYCRDLSGCDASPTHAVVDVERWLKGKAERAAEFGPFATNVTDHVGADGSNNVAITADIHDMAGAQAAMDSPEGAAAEERHGVIQPISVYIEKWSRTDRPLKHQPSERPSHLTGHSGRGMFGRISSRDQRQMSMFGSSRMRACKCSLRMVETRRRHWRVGP